MAKKQSATGKNLVLVTGDVMVEKYFWHNYSNQSELPYTMPTELRMAASSTSFHELGGAILHGKIIEEYFKALGGASHVKVNVFPNEAEYRKLVNKLTGEIPVCSVLHELATKPLSDGANPSIWRIDKCHGVLKRQVVGENSDTLKVPSDIFSKVANTATENMLSQLKSLGEKDKCVLVIHDRGVGDARQEDKPLRLIVDDTPFQDQWMKAFGELDQSVKDSTMILWNVRSPELPDGSIYRLIEAVDMVKQTIPVLSSQCLSQSGIEIRFDQSYETATKLLLASLDKDVLKALCKFPHVLIRFAYGVLHISGDGHLCAIDIHGLSNGPYFFEPRTYGSCTGMTPLFLCSIMREFFHDKSQDSRSFFDKCRKLKHPTLVNATPMDRAIDAALLLQCERFEIGFGDGSEPFKDKTGMHVGSEHFFSKVFEAHKRDYSYELAENSIIRNEHSQASEKALVRFGISEAIASGTDREPDANRMMRVEIITRKEMLKLSIANNYVKNKREDGEVDTQVAATAFLHSMVVDGIEAAFSRQLNNDGKQMEPSVVCPYVNFGKYVSIDPNEVDSLLSLRYLVSNYVVQKHMKFPLNIGVFGKPGSGKSFMVKNAIADIRGIVFDDSLVCNLSQIRETGELDVHFHRMQDIISRGGVPVAFFDEFDSPDDKGKFRFLKHFLMPMQDGKYTQSSEIYDISRSVLVFAGGSNACFQEFSDRCEGMKVEKAPDFRSRLKGILDISGIDLPERTDSDGDRLAALTVKARRATLLRHTLADIIPQVVDRNSNRVRIEPGIVNAFLECRKFTNGARSIRAIVEMSRVPPTQARFSIVNLPPRDQMSIHVDAGDFFRYINASLPIEH